MQNSLNFDRETKLLLDFVGAEPLEDSGFEEEIPEPEFGTAEQE